MAFARAATRRPVIARNSAASAARHGAQHTVPIEDLLPTAFIVQYTRFASLSGFLTASGLEPMTLLALDVRSRCDWDCFVCNTTDFADWDCMLRAARGEWVFRRMGIGA